MTSILNQSHTGSSVNYNASNPEAVERFLAQHANVIEVLRDAEKPLQDAFGKNVHVSVAVTTDPEETGREFVVSSIQTSLSATQARARLDKFDKNWWLDNAARAQGQLVFTVAFT